MYMMNKFMNIGMVVLSFVLANCGSLGKSSEKDYRPAWKVPNHSTLRKIC